MTKTGTPAALPAPTFPTLAFLTLALLAGCGRTEQAADPGASASPQRPQELANALPRGGGGLGSIFGGRGLPRECPRVAFLGDAADLTRFRAGSVPDLSTMEVDARLARVDARCEYASGNQGVNTTLIVRAVAERGPAATGRSVQLRYFVAVTDRQESQIFDRSVGVLTVTFPANANVSGGSGPEMTIRLPDDPGTIAARQILVGFELTPDEVALNRRRGPRS